MDVSYVVTDGNCLLVAGELVSRLRNKSFSVAYFETNISPRPEPKRVSNLRLYDGEPIPGFDPKLGYHFEKDTLTILVSPKRKLEWNMITDKVTIIFHDDGRITIDKVFLDAIFYTMIISFDTQ